MFKFLSIFKKNEEEQIDDNTYDLEETPGPGRDIVENNMPGSEKNKPKLSLSKPLPVIKPRPEAIALQQEGEQIRINEVRDELRDISDIKRALSGEKNKNTVPVNLQDSESPLDVSSITQEQIEKYDPKVAGYGGENIVYTLHGHPDVVVKAEMDPLLAQIEGPDSDMDENADNQIVRLQKSLAKENASYNELRTYFGNEHVPTTRRYVLNVPVSKDTLSAIYKAKRRSVPDVEVKTNELPTIVAIQENVPQITGDKSLDVRGGFAELRKPADMLPNTESYKKAYETATQDLVCNPESGAAFDLDQFLIIHPDLRPLIAQADTNPLLKEPLEDFVKKGMKYSKETGNGLDLAGKKNILFFEKPDQSWNYKLVDALSPHSEKVLQRAEGLMEKVAKEPLVDGEPFALTGAVNYVRIMNGLAKYLDIDEHLEMPHGQDITSDKLWNTLYEGKPREKQKESEKSLPALSDVLVAQGEVKDSLTSDTP